MTLAVTPTGAAAGATGTLIAVASPDVGMSAVRYYRVDASANTLPGTLNAALSLYQFTTTIPTKASGAVSYFARAVDADANTTDSNTATVTVTN